MISKLKDIELFKIILPLVVAAMMGLGSLLFAQTHKKIDGKADYEVIQQMLKVLEVKQETQKEQLQQQQKIDTETLKTLQNLNIQIILLNEQLKKE